MFMSCIGQEMAAVQLLSTLELSPENIINLVKTYDLDTDVADSQGNTRLMISSVNGFVEVSTYFVCGEFIV